MEHINKGLDELLNGIALKIIVNKHMDKMDTHKAGCCDCITTSDGVHKCNEGAYLDGEISAKDYMDRRAENFKREQEMLLAGWLWLLRR